MMVIVIINLMGHLVNSYINAVAIAVATPVIDISNADGATIKGLAIFGDDQNASSTISASSSDDLIIRDNLFGFNSLQTYISSPTDLSLDISSSDIGGFVTKAKQVLAEKVIVPAGYTVVWSGQFEYMQRAVARLHVIVPLTFLVIFFFYT